MRWILRGTCASAAGALAGAACAALLAGACQSAPEPAPPVAPAAEVDGERALATARHLTELRTAGGEPAVRAHLASELAAAGLGVREIETPRPAAAPARADGPQPTAPPAAGSDEPAPAEPLVHVVGTIGGTDSDDVMLLAAPYDGAWAEPPPGTCDAALGGTSGAALLLELARVLARQPLPYEVWVVFLDEAAGAGPPGSRLDGSRGLLSALTESGDVDRIRAAFFFDAVAERGRPIARDLYSHRTYRERIFRTAARLGHADVFPTDRPFDSPLTGHRVFLARGVRAVVAVAAAEPPEPAAEASVEPASGAEEAAGSGTGGAGGETAVPEPEPETPAELDPCSPEHLEAVAEVTLASLRDLAALLRKVDRFARPETPEPEAAAPEGDGGAQVGGGAPAVPVPARGPEPDASPAPPQAPARAPEEGTPTATE